MGIEKKVLLHSLDGKNSITCKIDKLITTQIFLQSRYFRKAVCQLIYFSEIEKFEKSHLQV